MRFNIINSGITLMVFTRNTPYHLLPFSHQGLTINSGKTCGFDEQTNTLTLSKVGQSETLMSVFPIIPKAAQTKLYEAMSELQQKDETDTKIGYVYPPYVAPMNLAKVGIQK